MNNSKHESQTSGKETMKSVSLRKTKKNIKTQKDKRYEIDNKLTDYCVTIQPVCSDTKKQLNYSNASKCNSLLSTSAF